MHRLSVIPIRPSHQWETCTCRASQWEIGVPFLGFGAPLGGAAGDAVYIPWLVLLLCTHCRCWSRRARQGRAALRQKLPNVHML